MSLKKLSYILILLLSGCVTTSGSYEVLAYDASGNALTENTKLLAEGSGIYAMRNAICKAYPKAKVIIKDVNTGIELQSESPYQCP